jgi:superfamily II DNA or RNA helicase
LDTIAQRISEVALSGNTLVLVDRINAGQELVARLGERAAFVSGGTKDEDRKEHYGEVADVDDKILVATYGVAAVGINVPRLFNVVLIEPGKSFVRVIQSIGRGLRKAEDKDYVQIWDVTSTCKFAKRHLTKRKQFYKEAQYPFQIEKIYYR